MFKSKFKLNIGAKSIILLVVCGLLVAADLLTKHFEEAYGWNLVIISGFIEIDGGVKRRNPGCAFGFLNDNPQIGQPILISLTIVMILFLLFAFAVMPERFTFVKVAITLVLGGALGNLVDRIMLHAVRDFIGLNMLFDFTAPIDLIYCNLADFFVVIGAVMIVIYMLFFGEMAVFPLTKKAKAAQARRKEEEKEAKSAPQNPDQPAVTDEQPPQEPPSETQVENTDADGGESG